MSRIFGEDDFAVKEELEEKLWELKGYVTRYLRALGIKDDILDIEEIAVGLLEEMQAIDPQKLAERYRLTQEDLELEPYDLLEAIGKKRGMLMSGGAVNTERAAIMLVDEFRASKIGRISLERPEDL